MLCKPRHHTTCRGSIVERKFQKPVRFFDLFGRFHSGCKKFEFCKIFIFDLLYFFLYHCSVIFGRPVVFCVIHYLLNTFFFYPVGKPYELAYLMIFEEGVAIIKNKR